jgi:predicted phage terminase large subunit-like protein
MFGSTAPGLPPSDRRAGLERLLKLRQEQHRRLCRSSLLAWAIEERSTYHEVPAAPHRLMLEKLAAVERGEIDRLMIIAPPRHGKSVYTSRIFPEHYLITHPRAAIIAASHTYSLAEDFGRSVRNTVMEHHDTLGYTLRADSAAAGRWNTSRGGQYIAAGVGMALSGRPGDLVLIDDPVPNREAADSQTQRDKTWNWYRGDIYQRLQPGGSIVVVMTRWHPDDLGGRLLEAEKAGGDHWEVLHLPAICDQEDDPLGREIGAALWPEWVSVEALERIKRAIGEQDFAALFQGRPRAAEGNLFKTSKIKVIDAIPYGRGDVVRGWDLAATEQKPGQKSGGPAWTAGVKLMRTSSDGYIILDVRRIRGGPEEVAELILNTARADGSEVKVSLPQDPGSAGKVVALYYTQLLAGYNVIASPESGSKIERANPVAAQVNVGNFSMLRGEWNATLVDEMGAFPSSVYKDQVDGLSRAFGELLPDAMASWLKLAAMAGARR